jgi:hypothetical protein
MNKYNVRFQFINSFFHQNKFDEIIESTLEIKQLLNQLQKKLIDNKEMYRVIKISKIN